MSDKRSSSGPDNAPSSEHAGWNSNGKHSDTAQAVADPVDAETVAEPVASAETEAGVASGSVVESVPHAETDTGASADAAPADGTADDGTAFLSELVKAMQTTAAAERTRITRDTDRRREAHLAKVQARREAESATMLSLADTDLKTIERWSDDERERIQAEHERRAAALRADLETSLAEHGAKIDREIEGVETAIATYRSETDAFFATLDHETDPVAIARHASQRPVFPVLDVIGVDAVAASSPAEATSAEASGAEPTAAQATTAEAMTAQATTAEATTAEAADGPAESTNGVEPTPVMDAALSSSSLASSWASWNAEATAPPTLGTDEATTTSDTVGDAIGTDGPSADGADVSSLLETAAVASGTPKLLQSTPVSRPMSWLRRDKEPDDHS